MWSQKTSGRSSVYACRCEEWKENCCGYEWLGRWDGSEGLRGMEEGMHRDLMGWEAPILTRLCYQQNWEDLSFEFEQPRKAPEQGSEILISARKKITVMLMFMKNITHIFLFAYLWKMKFFEKPKVHFLVNTAKSWGVTWKDPQALAAVMLTFVYLFSDNSQ